MVGNAVLESIVRDPWFRFMKIDHALENFCIRGGIKGPLAFTPICSGRNSAVFKVSSEMGEWILKHYFKHKLDKRDRLKAEYQFLTFLEKTGCKLVAEPIARDEKRQLALYSFLKGTKPSVISDLCIEQAAEFIILLHGVKDHPNAKVLENAADACFSLDQHLDLVNARFSQFKEVDPDSTEFLFWVKNVLHPCWLKIQANVLQLQKNVLRKERILSPSDFGFHNTLQDKGDLSFIDFEYAGWDSMSKLACDFICQPELPISEAQAEKFLRKVAQETNNPDLIDEVRMLLPIHRIKWCCILLNVFQDVNLLRREHSGTGSIDILMIQLNKAKYYFESHL